MIFYLFYVYLCVSLHQQKNQNPERQINFNPLTPKINQP